MQYDPDDLPGLVLSRPWATRTSHDHRVTAKNRSKINISEVARACVEHGLDPAVEIARVLKGQPLVDPNTGEVLVDPVTGEAEVQHLVSPEVRLRTLLSLIEYVQPKLKAVDVKVSGSVELSDEQLDQRLEALLQRGVRA